MYHANKLNTTPMKNQHATCASEPLRLFFTTYAKPHELKNVTAP